MSTPPSASPTSERIESRNPATGALLGSVSVASSEDVRAAVARARAAQHEWGARSIEDRCVVLENVQRRMLARQDELLDLITREVGRPRTEALTLEIGNHAALLSYFTRHAPRILRPRPIAPFVWLHRRSYLHYPPRGVVGVISPWNFPLALTQGPVSMALLAGNGVVVKPSEFTPLVQDLAREIWVEGGIPADLYQVVQGYGPTGAALVDAGVDKIVFTGSRRTGQKVAAMCGERLIPCTTELGGKAPALVLPDADLDRTAHALVWGAFANAGQVCASVERVFVPRSVQDALLPKLVSITESLRMGDCSADPSLDLGPLNNQRQLDIVAELVEDARAQGATVVTGGARVEGPGLFYKPTILTGVTPEMRIAREEIFGPVMPILEVETEDAMVRLANDTPLGLLAYVFSRDKAHARRVAERIEAGVTMVNDVIVTAGFPETPWGGVKQSGIGHTHSDDGLRDMCQRRMVHYLWWQVLPRELWWFPYGTGKQRLFKRIVQAVFTRGTDRTRSVG